MEVDQFISHKKAGMKARKLWRRKRDGPSYQVCSHEFISPKKAEMKACKLCRRRKRDGSSYQECSQEGQQETNEAEEDNVWLKNLSNYFRYFSVFFSVSSDNTRFSFMLGT